jgi:uncharacterized protein
MESIRFFTKDDWTCFRVKLQPRASECGVIGAQGDAVKIRVAAPPVENRANRELVDLLARIFKVPNRSVRILSGASARLKTVGISGISTQEARDLLAPYLV